MAVRSIRMRPGLPLTVVLTLALGIATTTAVFGALDAVVFRPLPVRDQAQLVVLGARDMTRTDPAMGVPNGVIADFTARSHAISGAAGAPLTVGATPFPVGDGDRTLQLAVTPVTSNFLSLLGVIPVNGRLFDSTDDARGEPGVVLSHMAWTRDFGARHDIVGHRVSLWGLWFSVIGVTPAGFDYPAGTDLWVSYGQLMRAFGHPPGPDDGSWQVVARLRSGASAGEARADFRQAVRQYQSPDLGDSTARDAVIRSYADEIVGGVRPTLVILFGSVALLLLGACANAAGLVLARGLSRTGELATRVALGASPADLLRQLLAESVVLAVAAGIVGLIGAGLLLQTALAFAPPGLARFDQIRFGAPAVAFAFVVSLGSALLGGLTPAMLSSSRMDVVAALRGAGAVARPRDSGWARQCLTVVQIALAVAVLAGATAVGDSLVRLSRVDLGFESHHLLYTIIERHAAGGTAQADITAEEARYREVIDGLVERLRGQPGIVGAAPTYVIPFHVVGGTYAIDDHYNVEGQSLHDNLKSPTVGYDVASDDYFTVLGIPLRRGRVFSAEDNTGSTRVAVVSEAMARVAWPGQDPLGKRVRLGNAEGQGPWRTVVGVVGDRRDRDLTAIRPNVYIPERQAAPGAVLAIRTTGDPRAALPIVARVLHDFDDGYRIGRAITIGEVLDVALAVPRFLTAGLVALSLVTAIVATIGIFAVLVMLVRERTHEISIRAALGATGRDIGAFVARQAAVLVGVGVLAGLVSGAVGARILQSFVPGLVAVSVSTMTVAAALMIAMACGATVIPALRAMRVTPVGPLRGA